MCCSNSSFEGGEGELKLEIKLCNSKMQNEIDVQLIRNSVCVCWVAKINGILLDLNGRISIDTLWVLSTHLAIFEIDYNKWKCNVQSVSVGYG